MNETSPYVSFLWLLFLSLVISLLTPLKVFALAGDLDTSFGIDGKVTPNISDSTKIEDIIVQEDGKILLLGSDGVSTSSDIFLSRFNSDGSLDSSFGMSGVISTDYKGYRDVGTGLAIGPAGEIVAVGYGSNGTNDDCILSRYNNEGSLDTSFDIDGTAISEFGDGSALCSSVAVQNDGKIVIAGSYNVAGQYVHLALARYNSNGTLDKSFDSDGKVITGFGSRVSRGAIALQGDGKIVAVGSHTGLVSGDEDFIIIRYNTDGSLDKTFGKDGLVETDFGTGDVATTGDTAISVIIQNDGKIIAAGSGFAQHGGIICLARYEDDGRLDTSFGNDGKIITDLNPHGAYASDLVLQDDGRILVSGLIIYQGANYYGLVRYKSDGSLDTRFGQDGVVGPTGSTEGATSGTGYGIALQNDRKILVAGYAGSFGYATSVLVRYDNDLTDPLSTLAIVSGTSGTAVSGEPIGTFYRNLGIPAINDAGELAFTAQLELNKVKTHAVVSGVNPTVVARTGELADGTDGAKFKAFKDPLLAQDGSVAFIAKIKGSGITPKNDYGIWTNAFGDSVIPNLLVQENDSALDVDGAKIKSFESVAVESCSFPVSVAFHAKLSGKGVNATNDEGLWGYFPPAAQLLLREGMTMYIPGEEPMVLKKFTALNKRSFAEGQGFGLCEGKIPVLLHFKNKKSLIATISQFGGQPIIVAMEGDAAVEFGLGAEFASFSPPVQNSTGAVAFVANVINGPVTKANNTAIYDTNRGLNRIITKGDTAPGIHPAATFKSFETVVNNLHMVSFIAKIKGTGVKAANDRGIWRRQPPVTRKIAREGDVAPESNGAKWSKFLTMALPANVAEFFVAKLKLKSGSPKVSRRNDLGLWGLDYKDDIRLLAREGVTQVDGKKVRKFKVLGVAKGSPSQTRSHNGSGTIAYWAQFTDGTQGIVTVQTQ